MRSILYLAWRYLASHAYTTAVLVLSIAMIAYIPAGLRVLVGQGRADLKRRAAATPLLLGAKGSPIELVLNALYFNTNVPETLPYGAVDDVRATNLARPIPLYVRFASRGTPIVGTGIDYFAYRGLSVREGRAMGRLGECVVGAAVARARGIGPGDSVISSPGNVFDLAGVYPLKMSVTGVLAPSDGPDDHVIFVDVRTAWIIEGLAHGHADLARPEAASGVLERSDDKIVANASVRQYNQITDDNVASFHFHGDPAAFPITAVIADPHDAKSATILLGHYQGDERLQLLRPGVVMDELLATILTVQTVVTTALVVVGAATLATAALVFMLSLRLRRQEIRTMSRIGGAAWRIATTVATEIVLVLCLGGALAGCLTWATAAFASDVARALLGHF